MGTASAQIASLLHSVRVTSSAPSFPVHCQPSGLSLGVSCLHPQEWRVSNCASRSKINGEVGARTQMSSMVCSAVVLLAVFYLMPWLYYLPKTVLGAV